MKTQILKTGVLAAATALASLIGGCELVKKVEDRLPHLQAKAPEILLDIQTKDWAELAKDVAEAMGLDPVVLVNRSVERRAQIVTQAPALAEAVEKKNWLLLALLLSDAFSLGR